MLTFLIRKRQRTIAWFLFLLFYTDMIGAAYASGSKYFMPAIVVYNHKSVAANNNSLYSSIPSITAELLEKKEIKPVSRVSNKIVNKQSNNSSSSVTGSLVNVSTKKNKPAKLNIGGPGQPEMSTFKSVGADNMVNLFTGDFSYNIPLLDVDGYPINIFYNAQPTMDQEASWVGLGWNVNPGVINRNMRGLPDDFDGSDKVTKEQSMKPDITIGVNGSKNKEVLGKPFSKGYSVGAFYNSKRGVGLEVGVNGEFRAHEKITETVKDDKTSFDTSGVYPKGLQFGLNVNSQTGLTPSVSFSKNLTIKDKESHFGLSTSIDFNSRSGLGDLRLSGEMANYKYGENNKIEASSSAPIFSSNLSFARSSFTPSIRMPVTNFNATFSLKVGREDKPGITKTFAISGYYTRSSIREIYRVQTKDAYGFMYYEKANADKNALLDFNRINDGSFTKKTPVISLPVYTYDVFSISGQGTGGNFRGYRGNMGYVRDNYTRTNPGKVNVGVDLGMGGIAKAGVIIGGVYSATIAGNWGTENALKHTAAFKESDKLEQGGFYFKNPGEKAIVDEAYYNNMGQDKLMRPIMGTTVGIEAGPPFLLPTTTLKSKFQLFNNSRLKDGVAEINFDNSYRKERDKRSQVISYLTALDADRVGLDKYIYSYQENVFKPGMCGMDLNYRTPIERYTLQPIDDQSIEYRKRHHISEITVQEGSKRYIYGLPVYQLKQKEVTFSVGENKIVDPVKGLVNYEPGIDNTSANTQGKDGLFQSETVDPYAHSFLLTAILSPDYSDLKGDGISDDDLGTAIKFNYSRVNKKSSSPNSWVNMNWRLPVEENKANFNRGLVTANAVTADNKALYTYGVKELWYTHSIESKNMIATFTVSDRKDGYGVINENGGIKADANGACQKKLDRIDLYSKADFVKYGTNAKPIKTVHFTYTYKLCKNYTLFNGDASQGNGKLTLESIYFTYNNNAHQKNKYRFKYANEDATAAYNSLENDRWGNYKPHTQNPGGNTSNEDYPYTNQNKSQADANAGIWSLNQVLLPSGAKIDVTYEADDYGYVQNRRAAQMTSILGFGIDENATPENKLFNNTGAKVPWDFSGYDYRYVFFNAPVLVKTKDDISRLYLQDFKQLLLKLWVKIPKDDGYEPIFVYCNIDDFGVVAASGNPTSGYNKFFIKVAKASHNNGSQIMETVYQFLRDQIPAKAFPGYDVSDRNVGGQVIKSLYGIVNNVRTGVTGFENNARWDGWCKQVNAVRSVARLSNPDFKKIGGGHRVKCKNYR